MSKFTLNDLKQTTNCVVENSTKIIEQSNTLGKDDSGTANIYFLDWKIWNSEKKRIISTQNVPDAKSYPFNKNGRTGFTHILNFQVIVDNLIPSNTFKVIRDLEKNNEIIGYDVRCKPVYSSAKAKDPNKRSKPDNAEDFLISNFNDAWNDDSNMDQDKRNKIKMFVDKDGNLAKQIWVRISPKDIVDCSLMTFDKKNIKDLKTYDIDNNCSIRQGISCILNETTASIKFDVWTLYDDDNNVVRTGYRVNNVKFTCNSIKAVSEESLYLPKVLESTLKINPHFCGPIVDVISGEHKIPTNIKYELKDGVLLHNETTIRNILKDIQLQKYLTKDEDPRRIWDIQDKYKNPDDTDSKYSLKFSAWTDQCDVFGIDTEKTYWYEIMSNNQDISCILFANYNEKSTLKVENNSMDVLVNNNENNVDGTYHFYVTKIIPDYVGHFEQDGKGIKLTSDNVKTIFEDANQGLDKNSRMYRTMMDKDSNRPEIKFISINGPSYYNPLHVDGLMSKVICLGSGKRPMIDCDDASQILDHPKAKFYAIANKPVTDTNEFLKLVSENNVLYQIFVIQNLDKTIEKKNGKK